MTNSSSRRRRSWLWRTVALGGLVALIGGIGLTVWFLQRISHGVRWGNAQPIHVAAYEGDVERIRSELSRGVPVDARMEAKKMMRWNVTPLHIAAEGGRAEAIRVLAAAGADVNAVDDLGFRPLHTAAEHGQDAAVRALLELGADASLNAGADQWASGSTGPLRAALRRCSVETVTLLLDHGATIEAAGAGLLADAGDPDRLGKLRLLVSAGVPVNEPGERGVTALLTAAIHDDVESARFLLAAGADIELAGTSYAFTPLMMAAYTGSDRVLTLLLDSGADWTVATPGFGSLVYAAAFSGHASTVKLLIGRGLDIDLRKGRESDNATPLHLAYWNKNSELIKVLLAAGADPEARTTDGRRPREFGR